MSVDDPVPTVRGILVRGKRPQDFLPGAYAQFLRIVQQLVRNAVMHRTYEDTNAPTHVYWFDDLIEISSPGGPYGAVNAGNFGQPGVVDYRNPILAEAMRVLGLVQRYGFGIPAARRLLRAGGHPEPDFRVEPSWVHCKVSARA